MHTKIEKWMEGFVWTAFFSLAAFTFTSNSLSALSHIFILPPILYLLYKKELFKNFSWSQGFLWAFVIWATLASFLSISDPSPLKSIFKLKHYAIPLLAIGPYSWAFSRCNNLKKILIILASVFCVSLILANISGIIALFTQFHPIKWKAAADETRAAGLYGMAITYGYGIQFPALLFVLMAIHQAREQLSLNKYLFWLAGLSSIAGLYLSYTRGALVGFAAALLLGLYFYSRKVFLWAMGGIVILGILSAFIINNSLISNNRLFQAFDSGSNTIRISQFQAAFYAAKEHPVFGLGWRQFESECTRIKVQYNLPHQEFRGHAHNVYLQVMADTGIIGLILFCCFLIFWMKELLEGELWKRRYLFPIIGAFIVSGLFQCIHIDAENTFFIMGSYLVSVLFSTKFFSQKF